MMTDKMKLVITIERRSSTVVRTLAYHPAGPGSIPGAGGENY